MLEIISDSGHVYHKLQQVSNKGKFSTVYRAVQKQTGMHVAVKMVSSTDTFQVQKLVSEYTNRVDLPGIVSYIDYGECNGKVFLISKWVDGTLSSTAKMHRLHPEAVKLYAINLLTVVHQLHNRKHIHGDIKAANVMLLSTDDQRIQLLDLGLTRTIPASCQKIYYSLPYASPEQLLQLHALLGYHTDLYNFACMLYEWLTGKLPFHHTHPQWMIHALLNLPLPVHANIPPDIRDILHKATSKPAWQKPPHHFDFEYVLTKTKESVDVRYQSADEFVTDLQNANWQKRPSLKTLFMQRHR